MDLCRINRISQIVTLTVSYICDKALVFAEFLDDKLNHAEQNVLTNLEGLFTSVLITIDSTAAYNQRKKRRFKRMCDLDKKATGVTVSKTDNGFLVGYKYDERAYLLKIR